jgi:hypothetical protein
MNDYEKTGNWKSPRKIEEEIRLYQRKRFEDYMELEDIGMLGRDLALTALRGELASVECPTVGLDTNALRQMMSDSGEAA